MPNRSEDHINLFREIFFPAAVKKWKEFHENKNLCFSHYTSAEALYSILENKEFWLRDVRDMNDTQEIQHGYELIKDIIQREDVHNKICKTFSVYRAGDAAKKALNDFCKGKYFSKKVFVACFSEHNLKDDHGRLSMWKGYGKRGTGVAVIPDKTIMNEKTTLPVSLSNVEYIKDTDKIEKHIEMIIKNVCNKRQELLKISQEIPEKEFASEIYGYLISALIYGSICIKHPGFEEEKEWRVVYIPDYLEEEKNHKWFIKLSKALFRKCIPSLLKRKQIYL